MYASLVNRPTDQRINLSCPSSVPRSSHAAASLLLAVLLGALLHALLHALFDDVQDFVDDVGGQFVIGGEHGLLGRLAEIEGGFFELRTQVLLLVVGGVFGFLAELSLLRARGFDAVVLESLEEGGLARVQLLGGDAFDLFGQEAAGLAAELRGA